MENKIKYMMKDHNKEPVKCITKLSTPLYSWWNAQRYLLPALLALAMMTALPPQSAFGQSSGILRPGTLTVKVASEEDCPDGTVLFNRTYQPAFNSDSQETITVEYGSWVCIEVAVLFTDYFIHRIVGSVEKQPVDDDVRILTYNYQPEKFPGGVPVPLTESYGDDGVEYSVEGDLYMALKIVVRNTQKPQIKLALPALMLTDRNAHTFDADDHFTDTGIGQTSTTASPSPDKLTYSAVSDNPAIATVSLSGSTVSVTASSEGSTDITVTATDLAGNTTPQTFSVAVDLPPAPAGTIEPLVLTLGEGTGTRDFSFANVGSPTYSVSTLHSDIATAEIAPGTTTVTVTPVGAGTTMIIIAASEGSSAIGQDFDVTVFPSPPMIAGGSQIAISAAENQVSVTTVSATGSGVVTYSVAGGADQALFQIDAASGALRFNSAPDFESTTHTTTYTVEVTAVAEQSGLSSRPTAQIITVTITNVPEDPVITSPSTGMEHSLTLPENVKEVTTVTADHNSDDGGLVWSVSAHDAFVFEISQAGVLSFKDAFVPDYENPRSAQGAINPNEDQEYWVKVTATNDNGSDMQLIKVAITNVDGSSVAPEISASRSSFALVLGTVQDERVVFVRPTGGGDVDSYSIDPALPAGLAFSTTTGRITGTPTAVAALVMYTITATNGAGSSEVTITIEVTVDTAPVFGAGSDITDQVYIAGKHRVNLTLPEATGGNAPLTYALNPSLLPEGLTLDPVARTITGVPVMDNAMASAYTWTVTDKNGDMAMVSETFEISVSANNVPQFSSPSKTITFTQGTSVSGESLSEATGGNGALVYTLTPELPSGLIFSADERTITGTPAVPGTTTHTYAATDSGDPAGAAAAEAPDAATQTVTVTVTPLSLSAEKSPTAGISIYPNAATDVIHIGNVVENVYYTLSDIHGKPLKTGMLIATKQGHSLDISSLSAGIYLLKTTIGGTSTTRRVIKQ